MSEANIHRDYLKFGNSKKNLSKIEIKRSISKLNLNGSRQTCRRFSHSKRCMRYIVARTRCTRSVGMPGMRLTTQAGALAGQVITCITPCEMTARY